MHYNGALLGTLQKMGELLIHNRKWENGRFLKDHYKWEIIQDAFLVHKRRWEIS